MHSELLSTKLAQFPKICITGASGWLGKETADLLCLTLGEEFQQRVTLISSNGRSIQLHRGTFPSISWEKFTSGTGYDLIIHLAFLNQDKAEKIGLSQYLSANRNITFDVLKFALRSNSGSVLLASSGAVSNFKNDINSDSPYEIYAGLKHEAEGLFCDSKFLEYVGIMRIWNISGIYATLDSPYALTSFISQAVRSNSIKIHGSALSSRTYINAQEMMYVYLMTIGKFDRMPLDSGGFNVNLLELASAVKDEFGGNELVISQSPTPKTPSSYVPNAEEFNTFAHQIPLTLSNVREQIRLMVGLGLI